MKEQKVIITDSDQEINGWLERGWTVTSVTAQHVAVTVGGNAHNVYSQKGKFCFLLEREK